MSIETYITQAWQRQAWWLWIFLPVSWLFGAVIWLRRLGYQRGWWYQYRAPIPVMIIGNITVGGSGKTPLIITLVQYLQDRKIAVGVISRGYGADDQAMPLLVDHQSQPSEVGDEPCLIVAQTGVPMAVSPNRQQAIEKLLEANTNLELIIADDGLQHYALARDIEWIVVDKSRGFGNRQLLPVGFLREPIKRLLEATVIWHQSPSLDQTVTDEHSLVANQGSKTGHTMRLTAQTILPLIDSQSISQLDIMAQKISSLDLSSSMSRLDRQMAADLTLTPPKAGEVVHAISGIGYPARFFATLRALGFEVIEHPYPDHFAFTWSLLAQYPERPIIMTSKDAVKFRVLALQQIDQAQRWATDSSLECNGDQYSIKSLIELLQRLWVLPVHAELSADCYQTLEQQLRSVGIML